MAKRSFEDVKNSSERILRKNGRPMKASQILDHLVRDGNIGNHMAIKPIRLAKKMQKDKRRRFKSMGTLDGRILWGLDD